MDEDFDTQSNVKQNICSSCFSLMGKLKFSHVLTLVAGVLFGIHLYGIFNGMGWGNAIAVLVASCSMVILANVVEHYNERL